jgi:hypothetical protein
MKFTDLFGPLRVALSEEAIAMRSILKLSSFVLLGTVLCSANALAQSAGPDEAIQSNGSVTQNVTLTAAQRSAIFNAIFEQPIKPRSSQFAATVGAPVPPTVDLIDLPDNAFPDGPTSSGFKYVLAANDIIVVVDPVRMRVVDVIHSNAKP